MRKSRLAMFVMLAIAVCTAVCVAQEKKPLSPPGEASVKFDDGKTAAIQYSRPSMRSRKIFGGLVPYDQVWRTGANAATSLKIDADLTIGGANVPAGSYTLYSAVGENAKGFARTVYDPFAGLNFSYSMTFAYGQELDSNLQGQTRLKGEFKWGDVVWRPGASFALVNGHLVVVNGGGTKHLPGRNTSLFVQTDGDGKMIFGDSIVGDKKITEQSPYLVEGNLWRSGEFKVIDGQLLVANGSFGGHVSNAPPPTPASRHKDKHAKTEETSGAAPQTVWLDFTYHGTSDNNGRTTIDPASLQGQTEIHGTYVAAGNVWTKGIYKVVDGRLLIANGAFERPSLNATGAVITYRGTSDENGKVTIDSVPR